MRRTLLLAALLCIFLNKTIAQDCKNYYFLRKNKTIAMTIYEKNGDVIGKQVYTVLNVNSNDTGATATINSEMLDKEGKPITKAHIKFMCKNGDMMLDMKMQYGPVQQDQLPKPKIKANQVYIEYPANMKPGDKLKDAAMKMTIDHEVMTETDNVIISDRKVVAKEKVTTRAGTWDCFKITYKSKVTIGMMGANTVLNLDGTEWFAPGFGIVKTQNKDGSTVITSIK